MRAMIALGAAIALAGCASPERNSESVGIANPASEHCIKIGGRLELRQSEDGTSGYCHLPDGRVVEEWELFRSSQSTSTNRE